MKIDGSQTDSKIKLPEDFVNRLIQMLKGL